MFAFDTGAQPARLFPGVGTDDWIDDDGLVVSYKDPTVARRHARQAEQRIAACATIEALREEWRRSSLIADGLQLGGFGREATDLSELYAARLKALAPNAPDDGDMGSAPDSGETRNAEIRRNGMWDSFDAGGVAGPFLVWSAKGTEDGAIGRESFYIREGKDKTDVTEALKKGFLMDVHALKTGWQQAGGVKGVAPKWQWGASPSQLPPSPGDDWKKGFSCPVAIGRSQKAFWEQSGAGAWGALVKLVPQIQAGPCNDPGKVPVVQFVGTEKVTFNVGGTVEPVLKIERWIDRPAILAAGVATGFDAAADTPPAPKAEPAPAPAPAGDFGEEW